MSEGDGDIELAPPTQDRIRQRAWAMSAVICRSFIETFEDSTEAAALHSRVLEWIDGLNLRPELESGELSTIAADIGSLDRQVMVDATWRSEGLAVIAWALQASDLPAHDQMVDPSVVANSVLFLDDDAINRAGELRLRGADELDCFAEIQLAIHWRIREFSLRPQAMDFRSFAENSWFGPLSVEGVALAEDDLAIDDLPIARASEERLRQCQSIASERHQAINWLRGWHEIYSEVDTST